MPPSGAPEFIVTLDGMATPVVPAARGAAAGAAAGLSALACAAAAGVNGADNAAPAVAAAPRNPRRDVLFPGTFGVLIFVSRLFTFGAGFNFQVRPEW
jgi:hypothetical protein